MLRKSPIAGSWYPGSPSALTREVDTYLGRAVRRVDGDLVALIAPHAGLMYSGPVAAHAYELLRDRTFDVAVLVGPSHFVGFEGVAAFDSGGFETPLGIARIDEATADAIVASDPVVRVRPEVHDREHSLEMQLPFIQRLAPALPVVPLLMGYQTAATATALGAALAKALAGRRALLVASSDLSHYHDAAVAKRLDAVVIDAVAAFDPDRLQAALDARSEHACGGGPIVSVMRAARQLGARDAVVLDYADSGDVSGDKSAVVGYMAAALGTFTSASKTARAGHSRD